MWEEFKKYCKYQDMKDLYNKVIPTLSQFETKMEEMSTGYEQSMEIIRRYDEIIAEKASKTSIFEIYQHLEIFLYEVYVKFIRQEDKHKEYIQNNE